MAFRFQSGDDGDLPVNHDINVTPFIDVMLVLLIIFMVAAPLATVDVKVDLPISTAQPALKPDKPIYVTVRENGDMFVGETRSSASGLASAVRSAAGGGNPDDQRIYLRADRKVPYERIMDAMNGLRSGGYLKIALIGLEGGVPQ